MWQLKGVKKKIKEAALYIHVRGCHTQTHPTGFLGKYKLKNGILI
jgi:hypothetical protein